MVGGSKLRLAAYGAVVAVAALCAPMDGAAQDVGVRAYLTPGAKVGVGTSFVLNVEVAGTQQLDAEPDLPDLGDFAQYVGSSTSSSMQVFNGRSSVTLTVQYRYQALSEGTFGIPSFDVRAGGVSRRTEPLRITVSGEAPAAGGDQAAGAVGADDLFITAEATKTRVLDGEPLVVEYRIWTRVDVSSFNFTRVPEPEGFWVEDITPPGQPEVQQLTRDGQEYATAVIRRVALVPTGVGSRTIDPIVLEAQVRVRRDDPLDRFFGRRSLFGTSTVPAGVVSEAVTIEVAALPAGAPQPFSGVVGSLGLSASVDRDSVEANGAVTLTVRAEGDGNLRGVPEPVLTLDSDFEVFPPEVTESTQAAGSGLVGSKTFEYVLIPRAPGQREIPALSFGYYDARSGAYRVAETDPIGLTVTGVVAEGPAALARGGVAELRRDIRFIHLGSPLAPTERPLFASALFWLFALLPVASVGGAVVLRRQRDLLEGDVAYARGRRAGRIAKKRLAEARGPRKG